MTDPRHYPDFIEAHWLSCARSHTRTQTNEEALEKLRPAVQALSDLFTTERPDGGFPDYAADPAKRIAYGLFFFPQSFVKCALALDQLLIYRQWRPAESAEPLRLLDLGSASGPCGIAAALRLARETGRKVVLTALDHSPSALSALSELAVACPQVASQVSVRTVTGDLRRAPELLRDLPPQDFVTIGFAANEIFGSLDEAGRLAWVESLKPLLGESGLVLILEPALRETATALRRLRDAMLKTQVLHPRGPDVAATPCPLIAGDSKFWDHEVREWTAPDSLEFLNRKLHRDLRVLKFTQIAFGKHPEKTNKTPGHIFRITSPFEANKGGFAFSAITAEGVAVKIDIPNRGLSKSECKRLSSRWERGDIAGCDDWTPLGSPGTFRIPDCAKLITLYHPGDAFPPKDA